MKNIILNPRQLSKAFILLSCCSSLMLTACQNLRTREQVDRKKEIVYNPPPVLAPVAAPEVKASDEIKPPAAGSNISSPEISAQPTAQNFSDNKKIILVLGPGALRAYAHIGVLQALDHERIRIDQIYGIEMGSLVAALYAQKGQISHVEWQMMKLKEEDFAKSSGLFGSSSGASPVSLMDWKEDLNAIFGNEKISRSNISFGCPSLILSIQRAYLWNDGTWLDHLPSCMAHPPLFEAYQGQTAMTLNLDFMIDKLRQQKNAFIIYIDLLGHDNLQNLKPSDYLLWSQIQNEQERFKSKVDAWLPVKLPAQLLTDFAQRRNSMIEGQKQSANFWSDIKRRIRN